MYKVIYFLLVAAISACLYIGATQENMVLVAVGLLAGPILTLVWGLWIKAGAGRIILAALLSAIPGIGPWIGFLMLVRKTPTYMGAGARIFRWSVLLALFFLLGGVLLLIQFIKAGGMSNLGEDWSGLIVILVLFLLGVIFLLVGDWLLKTIGKIVKFLINAYYFLVGLLVILGVLVAGVGLIIGSVMDGITENWLRLILGFVLVIGDLIFIRWMVRKAVIVYHAEQEQAARQAANVKLPEKPQIPAPPAPAITGSLTSDEIVSYFNTALKNRDMDTQEKLLSKQAPCPHCGKQVAVMDAWMVRQDNSFACPVCKLPWS
jgi:predicted RNA-binding Zn-ribbon protein involved in translation (DUF1610 family)